MNLLWLLTVALTASNCYCWNS